MCNHAELQGVRNQLSRHLGLETKQSIYHVRAVNGERVLMAWQDTPRQGSAETNR